MRVHGESVPCYRRAKRGIHTHTHPHTPTCSIYYGLQRPDRKEALSQNQEAVNASGEDVVNDTEIDDIRIHLELGTGEDRPLKFSDLNLYLVHLNFH